MTKAKDLTGKVFNRLTAISRAENDKHGKTVWECRCDCGSITRVSAGHLNTGHTQSCGCLKVESSKDRFTTHGCRHSPEYQTWCSIKERCLNSNNKGYPAYGGSGITIAEEFAESFEAFLAEVGEKPKDGKRYSIDRIDNNLGYLPGNMRWATPAQQARNQGIRKDNTSGVTGVKWYKDSRNNTYAIAYWVNLEGESKAKSFSVNKYGLLEVFAMAVRYRQQMIEQLNQQGADYSCNHGL